MHYRCDAEARPKANVTSHNVFLLIDSITNIVSNSRRNVLLQTSPANAHVTSVDSPQEESPHHPGAWSEHFTNGTPAPEAGAGATITADERAGARPSIATDITRTIETVKMDLSQIQHLFNV